MEQNYAGPIFPKGGVKEGQTIVPGRREVKAGHVDGPWVINHYSGRYGIVDALAKPLETIGIRAGKKGKGDIGPVPKSAYSAKTDKEQIDALGGYLEAQQTAAYLGRNVVEMPAYEMEQEFGAGINKGYQKGRNLYVGREWTNEKKTEILIHELFGSLIEEGAGRNHVDVHPIIEKWQGPVARSYFN